MIPMHGPVNGQQNVDETVDIVPYFVCYAPGHGSDQDDATPIAETPHLLSCCLCREQHSIRVHVQNLNIHYKS